jgi:hypothetical protein
MINSETEKVMLAKVIVAAAVVDSTARALSTVDLPTQSPTSTPTSRRAAKNPTTTAIAGRKKKLARKASDAARTRCIIAGTPSVVLVAWLGSCGLVLQAIEQHPTAPLAAAAAQLAMRYAADLARRFHVTLLLA